MTVRRVPQGRGLFEFLILIIVIALLGAVFLSRIADIERQTEQLAVDLTIRNIRVGLQLAIGERIMEGREDSLADLLVADPLEFLGRVPEGYFNEPGPPPASARWHFSRARHELTYWPRQPEAFGGRRELHWQLRAVSVRGGRVDGLRLEVKP
ncbi:MAG: hypothetical protein JSR19_08455 [Proteobacteria bacterium]|nr:hypothetical protein [Pseudomonadota bacterium]HQR04209.1 hypothetical protein [Rhodocyclaceae bacterium]